MYIDKPFNVVNGKRHQRVLLRESYRENGKVCHRTVANLSACKPEEIAAIELALKHKHDLASLGTSQPFELRQGDSIGAVWLLNEVATRIGLVDALGRDRAGKLALWQVIARALRQGSRLGAVRLAKSHAVAEVLGLEGFNEDHLYPNLAWLSEQQATVEKSLLRSAHEGAYKGVFLYDVTSSYLEGEHNALGAWGYNRDKKKGKKQIVVGLLCDANGLALSIEVFAGNTTDPATFGPQVQKVLDRFGATQITFVGDRGMIKGPQIEELRKAPGVEFHYVTAISKPQIEKLLGGGLFQMELFDRPLAEVLDPSDGVRYVLRRNPVRAEEIRLSRKSKLESLQKAVGAQNARLADHPRAGLATALADVERRRIKLGLDSWTSLTGDGRQVVLAVLDEALAEQSKLDGCYVIKTDLAAEALDAASVHARYKDLAMVEQAFRTSKTAQLELRPIYVRCEASTRGHVFVVMLAYRLVQELQACWASLDCTVEEGLLQLDALCLTEVLVSGKVVDQIVPEGRALVAQLLKLAKVEIPRRIKAPKANVYTKVKLKRKRK